MLRQFIVSIFQRLMDLMPLDPPPAPATNSLPTWAESLREIQQI